MTKEEFKVRWDSDANGGGITYDDIAQCAIEWGLYANPRIHDIHEVAKKVVDYADCRDKY